MIRWFVQHFGAKGTNFLVDFQVQSWLNRRMDRPNTVAALKDKRAEITGRIDALQDQLRQQLIDLDHIDCTILIFDPDAQLDDIKPKPMPPRHHAFKGQVTRSILDMLRTSKKPLDGLAITMRIMQERELNAQDKKLVKTIQKRIGAALRNLRDRGLVVSKQGNSGLLLWELVQNPGAFPIS